MKSFYLTAMAATCLLFACNNSKKAMAVNNPEKLNGSWVLNYVSVPGINSDSLYPNKKPEINFSIADGRVSGTTGCNSFSGPVKIDGNKISFAEPLALTRMMCPGQGESVFLETLKKVNTYSADGKTLTLIMGDIAVMRFSRR